MVNTSTGGAIYGEGQIIPAPEDHPVAPEAPYGLSKFCAENYCALFTRLHGLSTVSLRYGNVYGPRQDPLGEAGVIAIFCGKLLDGGRPTIFGDGEQTRDYVYVGDVVERQPARGRARTPTGAFNVGRGVQTSVLDIVDALAAHADDGFERRARARPPRRGAAHRARPLAREGRARLGGPGRPRRRASRGRSTRCADPRRFRPRRASGRGPRRSLPSRQHERVLAPGEGETIRPGFEIKVGRPELVLDRGDLRSGRHAGRTRTSTTTTSTRSS